MDVRHDPAGSRFLIDFGAAQALLHYALRGGVMDIRHVVVPPGRRGQGVAARLTTAAFEYARSRGLRVLPSCPYVGERFLARHGEYDDLVVEEGDAGA